MVSDIVIIRGTVLTLKDGGADLVPSGFVSIKDGAIQTIGDMADLPDTPETKQTIDASGALVMPGLVNTHTHAAMTLFRGLADDIPLMTWLNEYIFPAEARFVEPEMVYWCSKLAAAEMILSGTTTVADSYFYEDAAAEAFLDAGLRAVAAQGVIDFPAPGVPDPAENINKAAEYIDRWQGRSSLVTPAVFCHSPYTCSPETLKKTKKMAREKGVRFFIHTAETNAEVEQIKERFQVSPVRHLYNLGILDTETVCVHCAWLTPEDIEILSRTGTHVSICPESNMKLASGIAPVTEMLAQQISLGLGTDSCASNNDLDLFREMDSCAKLYKITNNDPTALPARKLLQMTTLHGAQALEMNHFGSLEPGKRADIIILDLQQPHLTPFYNTDLLVYAARGADVLTVIIDGLVVMRDRKLLTFNMAETIENVRALSRKITAAS